MGLLGNIAVGHKRPKAGSPFPPGSADNGLSVDPITGNIVLGNDVGDNLATLLSTREIPMAGFDIELTKAIGNISFSGGINNGGITDVTTNNFYAAFTGFNRSAGNNALAYSGVYNDLQNAILLISTGSGYNQGAGSYDPNAMMLYADSLNSPFADLYVAGDANTHFLLGGLNSSFIVASMFRASGNMRIANDATDSFSARLQVRGDIDNIIDIIQQDGQSRAVFGPTGNLIMAPGAAGTADLGQAIQLYLDSNQPAMYVRDVLGVDVLNIFEGGNMQLGMGLAGDTGDKLQVIASAGQGFILLQDTAGNTALHIDQFAQWIVTNGFPNWAAGAAAPLVWNSASGMIEQIAGFSGTFLAQGGETVTVEQGIIISVV